MAPMRRGSSLIIIPSLLLLLLINTTLAIEKKEFTGQIFKGRRVVTYGDAIEKVVEARSKGECSVLCVGDPGCHGATFQNDTSCVLVYAERMSLPEDPDSSVMIISSPASYSLGANPVSAAVSCLEILNAGIATSGVYWLDTPSGPVETVCDMDAGGWTLIGENGGFTASNYATWLRDNVNTVQLSDTSITSGDYACIDAVNMAVNNASSIRLSSEGSGFSMGSKWVEWMLPAERDVHTFWNVGQVPYHTSLVGEMEPVYVTSWDGSTGTSCYQNKYGISVRNNHGASYPSTAYNTGGNSGTLDACMAVQVMQKTTGFNGWTHFGAGRDCPTSDSDWPNALTDLDCFLAVWIK